MRASNGWSVISTIGSPRSGLGPKRPMSRAMKRRTSELTDETVQRIVDEAHGWAEESKREA